MPATKTARTDLSDDLIASIRGSCAAESCRAERREGCRSTSPEPVWVPVPVQLAPERALPVPTQVPVARDHR
jgi:hypothetical protein